MVESTTAAEATPWIETSSGGLFFVNSLLVAPAYIVLLSHGVWVLLRSTGASPFLVNAFSVFPTIAEYVVPVVGWLLVVPIWSTLRNLRIEPRALPRGALALYLATHLGFFAYTVWFWTTGQSFPATG